MTVTMRAIIIIIMTMIFLILVVTRSSFYFVSWIYFFFLILLSGSASSGDIDVLMTHPSFFSYNDDFDKVSELGSFYHWDLVQNQLWNLQQLAFFASWQSCSFLCLVRLLGFFQVFHMQTPSNKICSPCIIQRVRL